MKKIILLLIIPILLTGCTATYEINITKDSIDDIITIKTSSTNIEKSTKEQDSNFYQKIGEWENGHDFYKKDLITSATETGYQYTYSFDYIEYDAMSQIRKCYQDFNFKYDKGISLSTSKTFLCKEYYKEIKDITIKITSEYEITNSNADSINGNTHIWKINDNNYQNKPINISINKSKKYTNTKQKENNTKYIITIGAFAILILIFLKLKKDIKK